MYNHQTNRNPNQPQRPKKKETAPLPFHKLLKADLRDYCYLHADKIGELPVLPSGTFIIVRSVSPPQKKSPRIDQVGDLELSSLKYE